VQLFGGSIWPTGRWSLAQRTPQVLLVAKELGVLTVGQNQSGRHEDQSKCLQASRLELRARSKIKSKPARRKLLDRTARDGSLAHAALMAVASSVLE
jgi:hypothetical protein